MVAVRSYDSGFVGKLQREELFYCRTKRTEKPPDESFLLASLENIIYIKCLCPPAEVLDDVIN
jgi:hypothetical protein